VLGEPLLSAATKASSNSFPDDVEKADVLTLFAAEP
jgi:hypothetical protein